jgi:ribosomal protein L12E/L44/L45/RPP1/RPP2
LGGSAAAARLASAPSKTRVLEGAEEREEEEKDKEKAREKERIEEKTIEEKGGMSD